MASSGTDNCGGNVRDYVRVSDGSVSVGAIGVGK